MATNPAAIYYGPSAQGDAQQLGSGLGALTVLRQENARRQAEQARIARLRQQQEQADARNISFAGDTKGWLPHNEELSAMKKAAVAKMLAIGTDPKISPIEKKALQQEEWNGVLDAADKSRQLNKAYTERLATVRADKRYNQTGAEKALYGAAFTTGEDGQPRPKSIAELRADEFDAKLTDTGVFNSDEVLKQFIKAESDKENQRFGTAAAPGGYGQTNSFNSDIFASKNGKQVFNADGSPAIRDINALLQRAHRDPFMAAILRDNSAKAQQAAGAGAMTSGGEQDYAPLTAEQQMGMAALPRAASAERINLANLVTDYGKVKSSSTQTYRAAPVGRSSASGKPKFTTNDPNAGGYANYGISTNRDGGSTAGSATIFQGEAPTRISSTGKVEAYTRDNAVFNEYIVQQPGKSAELVKNNTRPQNLQFESVLHVLRTPTGNIVRPTQAADTKTPEAFEAWYKRAKAENPKAKGEWVVQATPKKGDNQLSSEDDVYGELADANDRARGAAKKSEPELRAQARKLVGEQNAVYYIPYTGDNARRLNAYTDNFYEKGAATRQKVVDDFERRSTPGVTGPASLLNPATASTASPSTPTGANRFRRKSN